MALDAEAAVPSGPMTVRFRRWLAVLVGLAAVTATVLAFVESDSGRREEEAFVRASRLSIDIFMKLAAGQPRVQFQADTARRSTARSIESNAQVLTSKEGPAFDLAVALAKAEPRAADQALRTASAMAAVSSRPRGVDPKTYEALTTGIVDLPSLVAAQNAAVDRAGESGTVQERSMFGLALVAIGASLLGLAGLMGATRSGRIALATAGGALGVALVSGLSGFLA